MKLPKFILTMVIGGTGLSTSLPAQEPIRFRVEISVESTLDLAAMGLPKQTTEQRIAGFLSITTHDSATGTSITTILDSIRVELGSVPQPDQLAAEATGIVIKTYRTRAGKFSAGTFSRTHPFATLMETAIADLIPVTAPSQSPSWNDTLNVASNGGPGSMARHQITRYTHRGNSSYLGQEAQLLDVEFDLEITGKITTEAGDADISGKGSGTGNYYIKSGELLPLGVSRITTQQSQLSLNGLAGPLPVESRTTMVATRIR